MDPGTGSFGCVAGSNPAVASDRGAARRCVLRVLTFTGVGAASGTFASAGACRRGARWCVWLKWSIRSLGTCAGSASDDGYVYLGIPYAAPPFGANRLRPPQPVEPWSGVRDATELGPEPPQVAPPATGGPASGAAEDWAEVDAAFAEVERAAPTDDCLNLNVWTPDPGATGLPVMVWIQGGMFELSSTAAYDGSRFARDGVVCVVINWRPGAEGFLYLDDGIANVGCSTRSRRSSGCARTSSPSAETPATSPSSASRPGR